MTARPIRLVGGRASVADDIDVACPVCGRETCEDATHAAPDDRTHQTTAALESRVADELDRQRVRREATRRLNAEEQARRDADVPDAAASLLDDVAVLDVPEPPMLVAGRLPSDALALLVGPPGVGKSLVGLDLAVSIATGRDWCGNETTRRGPVLWVLAEGGVPRFARRLRAAKLAADCDLSRPIGIHTWPGAVALLDSMTVAALASAARVVTPALIVLDTLSRCTAGADENSAQDASSVVAALDGLRAAAGGALVLALHHVPKDGRMDPRGSTVLSGAVDTIVTLQSAAADRLRLACSKQRDAAPFAPLLLRLAPSDESVVPVLAEPADGPPVTDSLDDDILGALADRPMSGKALATRLDHDRRLVLSRLRRLEREGQVKQDGDGRSTQWRAL